METSNAIECPCCGQPVPEAKFLADPTSNVITNGDKTVKMSTQQFKLARYLIEKFPNMATKEQIYDNVFMAANGEGPGLKIVDVIVCKVRPLLAEVDLVISTVWGKGYQLMETDRMNAMSIRDAGIRMRSPGSMHRWTPEDDEQLRYLASRKFNVSQCATVMRLPYMTIERHMKAIKAESLATAD